MPSCGLTLPCKQTIADKQDALSITNKRTGAAFAGTSAGGPGVHGTNGAGSGLAVATVCGVWGDSDNAFGVHGTSKGAGVRGESSGGFGVHGSSQTNDGVNGDSNNGVGVRGISNSAEGVRGESQQSDGVHGETNADGAAGVAAINRAAGGFRNALFAHSDGGNGVWAEGRNGIIANASKNWTNNVAVFAHAQSDQCIAVYGYKDPEIHGYAGYFYGPVEVAGTLYKLGGGLRIDHPLDPAGKHLSHSFVESDEMKNVYDGVVALNAKGHATIKLPAWFDALNGNFRYQLTPIGGPAPDLHIAEGITGNSFTIGGGKPRMQVSWQVTGVRKDRWAEKNRIVVEEKKGPDERGCFHDPIVHGKAASNAIAERRRPDQRNGRTSAKSKAKAKQRNRK